MRTSRRPRLFVLSLLTALFCLVGQSLLPATASSLAQQVQRGVEAYRSNQYGAAIAHWSAALTHAQAGENIGDRAIILENIARAHGQLGQPASALPYWQQATAISVAQQDWPKVGRQLTQQAQTYSRLGQPFQAIGLLCQADTAKANTTTEAPNTATADRATALLSSCTPESAVAIAQKTNDKIAEMAALGTLGETYRAIQRYPLALHVLQASLQIATEQGDIGYQALLHNSIGNTYREQSDVSYQRALVARRSAATTEQGFLRAARGTDQLALQHFADSEAASKAVGAIAPEIKAVLGIMAITGRSNPSALAALYPQALSLWNQLPPNQSKVYLGLQLVHQRRASLPANVDSSERASRTQCQDILPDASTRQLLQQLNDLASTLGNNRLQAFTQGELGHYYECTGNYNKAMELTQQARLAASGDKVLALDTLYLWQWQTARLYQAQAQTGPAIEYYTQAVENLNRVRAEILSSNQTLQFDFRDAVAPVYRELAEIQLSLVPEYVPEYALRDEPTDESVAFQQVAFQQDSLEKSEAAETARLEQNTQNITSALGNIDNLQLAELQNYFGSDCLVPVADRRIDQVLNELTVASDGATAASSGSSQQAAENDIAAAALISTIIFPNRTAVVLTLPGQSSLLHWINLPEQTLRQSIISFRNSLEDTANELEGYDTRQAESLYKQIIQPFESVLERSKIKMLLFVNDGILRNIPMAALYDGNQYLIERYGVAIAPSLQSPVPLTQNALPSSALVLGLSQNPTVNGQGLGALPAVRREVQEVVSVMPGSDLLLNEAFTKDNLKQNLFARNYPVLHIATHGQFETEPINTFLVTGDKEPRTTDNQLLRLGELDALIRAGTPENGLLDLIVLSACQTASGDERATLGLAGVTIRAGANTALASLWSVNDESTADLITAFYQNWRDDFSKAEALRAAQIAIMKDPRYFQHPAYWSAFMLVGDWQ